MVVRIEINRSASRSLYCIRLSQEEKFQALSLEASQAEDA